MEGVAADQGMGRDADIAKLPALPPGGMRGEYRGGEPRREERADQGGPHAFKASTSAGNRIPVSLSEANRS